MSRKNKKGTFLIRTLERLILVPGILVGDTGLGFFKSEKYTTKKDYDWSLTHTDGGRSICRFRTRKALMASLDSILPLADWKQPEEILVTRDLKTKMNQIQNEEK